MSMNYSSLETEKMLHFVSYILSEFWLDMKFLYTREYIFKMAEYWIGELMGKTYYLWGNRLSVEKYTYSKNE
jgi:hypothetical protein